MVSDLSDGGPLHRSPTLRAFMLALVFTASNLRADEAGERHFERRVRPLLVARCLGCHGTLKQEGGLRLDSREAVLRGGDRGPAAVPGDPDGSLLVVAVRRGGDLQMPPEPPLDATERDVLASWVAAGLPWPAGESSGLAESHWAFRPIRRPPPPDVTDKHWSRDPLDRHVLATLEREGLTPSPEADRLVLMRRLWYDLLGLPPPPEEIDAFLADSAPDAYDRLVDRLLASPAYGERWGRHWLDVARYADDKGYVFFEEQTYPWAYAYRDYVVAALNDDTPYDRFILEQLAADQLADLAGPERLAALGFLTIGGHFMNSTHDILDDRIDVVSRGLLGLTLTCARCHDHKYDPLSMADYYGLYGVFRNSVEPLIPPALVAPADTDEQRQYAAELTRRAERLRTFVESKHRALVRGARTRVDEYLRAVADRRGQPAADDFMLIADPNDINPSMITRWEAYLRRAADEHDPVWAPWHAFAAVDPASWQELAPAVLESLRQAGSDAAHPTVVAALLAAPPESLADVAERYGALFRALSQAADGPPLEGDEPAAPPLDEAQRAVRRPLLDVLYGEGSPADVPVELDWGFLSLFPDRATQARYKELLKEVEQWLMSGPGAPPRAMALVDLERPRDAHLFLRGNPNQQGAVAPRRFPAAFDPESRLFTRGSGRLELAERIVESDNPLTARVIVNRIWGHQFGVGLVDTPGDFGLRSQPPSHPGLLDELAADLQEQGWSLKRLHRRIVLSATYRQSSAWREEAGGRDPENRWLWRKSRRRLEYEAQRDTLLSVAGRLESRMGGPAADLLGGLGTRRSVYGQIRRLDVAPLLTTFDFPNPAATSPKREATTAPPQALYFLNHPQLAEAAESLLRRPDVAPLERDARVERVFRLLFGRLPDDEERAASIDFLGQEPSAGQWVQWAHALLMTNELVHVD